MYWQAESTWVRPSSAMCVIVGPGRPVVDRGGAVELDSLGVHRLSQQRHVVLPADDRTDAAEGRVDGVERQPVPESPDEPLRTGGHELPVSPGDPGLGIEHECGAAEGVAEPFYDADDDEDFELSGDLGQSLDFRSVERDRAGAG